MSDCEETLRELETYLDGELTGSKHDIVHRHLGGCLDCAQALDFQAELRSVIREKCRNDELPAGLVARIEQCLQEDFDGDGSIG